MQYRTNWRASDQVGGMVEDWLVGWLVCFFSLYVLSLYSIPIHHLTSVWTRVCTVLSGSWHTTASGSSQSVSSILKRNAIWGTENLVVYKWATKTRFSIEIGGTRVGGKLVESFCHIYSQVPRTDPFLWAAVGVYPDLLLFFAYHNAIIVAHMSRFSTLEQCGVHPPSLSIQIEPFKVDVLFVVRPTQPSDDYGLRYDAQGSAHESKYAMKSFWEIFDWAWIS